MAATVTIPVVVRVRGGWRVRLARALSLVVEPATAERLREWALSRLHVELRVGRDRWRELPRS